MPERGRKCWRANNFVIGLVDDEVMTATQLEALVMEAIARMHSGVTPEDDRIEFKRDWPRVDKARQLAGAANRASGEWLIYVIGVDEKDGSIHPPTGTDPATWWAQIEMAFDEVSPELVRHLNVKISEVESVVVLQFRTDRAPYVVKIANGGATEREVPIRVTTGTRSAHRHELIRLLLPSVSVPTLDSLSTYVSAGRPSYLGDDSDTITVLSLWCNIYFEHLGPHRVFLPSHLASATLIGNGFRESTQIYYSRPTVVPDVTFGLSLRGDGIELSGPGTAYLEASWKAPRERQEEFGRVDQWQVRLEFGVAGTDRMAQVEMTVGQRIAEPDRSLSADSSTDIKYGWTERRRSVD